MPPGTSVRFKIGIPAATHRHMSTHLHALRGLSVIQINVTMQGAWLEVHSSHGDRIAVKISKDGPHRVNEQGGAWITNISHSRLSAGVMTPLLSDPRYGGCQGLICEQMHVPQYHSKYHTMTTLVLT